MVRIVKPAVQHLAEGKNTTHISSKVPPTILDRTSLSTRKVKLFKRRLGE